MSGESLVKQKVLVVEDERLLLKTIAFKLSKENFEVKTAADGREAMKLLEEFTPNLVVSDVMMPFVNGLELVKQLKDRFKNDVKVILLTSLGQEDTVMKAFDLGVDDFMTKPFSPTELTLRIKRLLK